MDNVLAIEHYAARIGRGETRQHHQRCRLAGTAWPKQGKKLARPDVQIHVVDNRQLAIPFGDILETNTSLCAHDISIHFAHSLATTLRFFAHHCASSKNPCLRLRSPPGDRTSVVLGKSVSVRLDFVGRRIYKK